MSYEDEMEQIAREMGHPGQTDSELARLRARARQQRTRWLIEDEQREADALMDVVELFRKDRLDG